MWQYTQTDNAGKQVATRMLEENLTGALDLITYSYCCQRHLTLKSGPYQTNA